MARRGSRGGGRSGYEYGGGWAPYVPVAERRAQAESEMAALRKRGVAVDPVVIEGRTIAKSVWGAAWCAQMESFADYANRLPRGRTYARNGSVVDLQLASARVTARVQGSALYRVEITVEPLSADAWKQLASRCAGKVSSLVDLLKGKLSADVMSVLAAPRDSLLPRPGAMRFKCSCPDGASLCKHVAATLYGVGARLDTRPELLFTLRNVDPAALLAASTEATVQARGPSQLDEDALADVFGIALEDTVPVKSAPVPAAVSPPAKGSRKASKSAPVAPATLTGAQLLARGVPRSTFQNWVRNGGLALTAERGVYRTTALTEAMITAALARRAKR